MISIGRVSSPLSDGHGGSRSSDSRKSNGHASADGEEDTTVEVRSTPYWLIKWWLTKNTTNRPTVSKHPLLELLLEENLVVVSVIAAVTPQNQESQIASALVRVFDGCGRVLDLINYFVDQEVQATTYVNTLFRENSMASKMMTSYARVAGAQYLRQAFAMLIKHAMASNLQLEIDPSKLGGDKTLAANNLKQLLSLARRFLTTVVDTVAQLPLMFRRICSILHSRVSSKFGTGSDNMGIGGFLFLRFFCPAFIAPEAFGIVMEAPPPKVRRTLVLVSKLLQNLVNEKTSSKEEFMKPTDCFITDNTAYLKDYFAEVTRVPSGAPERDPYLIPISLVEESLSVLQRHILNHIDEIKASLGDAEMTEAVTYNIFDNLHTIVLKMGNVVQHMKQMTEFYPQSHPIFKPWRLFIDAIVDNRCFVAQQLIQLVTKESEVEEVASSMMALAHAQDMSVVLVKELIKQEIGTASEPSQPFAKSISGKLVQGYYKMLSVSYLQSMWAGLMRSVNTQNECLELDPTRAPPGHSVEQAAVRLSELGKHLILALIAAVHDIPAQMREVIHFIQHEMNEKFSTEFIVDPSFSARLCCLRLYVPAISYPTVFGLLPEMPNYHSRRTLVLAAKLLRNTFLGQPFVESYLVPLNPFIEENHPTLCDFMEQMPELNSRGPMITSTRKTQVSAVIYLHQHLTAHMEEIREKLANLETTATMVYCLFDRMSAVIALYRYKLRRRTILEQDKVLTLTITLTPDSFIVSLRNPSSVNHLEPFVRATRITG